MTQTEITKTENLYTRRYEQYGDSYKTLDWGNQEGQWLRFKILAEIGDISNSSILDVGCGLGHFVDWLEEQQITAQYTGLDLTSTLVTAAQKRHPHHQFITGDIQSEQILQDQSFDYVFASGVFSTYHKNAFGFQKSIINRLWSFSQCGIAFNSLSVWAENKEAGEYYADPFIVADFCRLISPWVVLRHDYHPRDFTIYLTKLPRK